MHEEVISSGAGREQQELDRRERIYHDNSPPEPEGKTAILIDDGLATGITMQAAIAWLRAHNPAHIVVAVPKE